MKLISCTNCVNVKQIAVSRGAVILRFGWSIFDYI